MKDQLDNYFKNTDFDVDVPRFGHLDRFEEKLKPSKKNVRKFSYKWMGVAASIILVFGFYLGANLTDKQILLADVSPEMAETETFFVTTIKQELVKIENNRSPKTERIIEDALNQLESLEDKYKELVKALNSTNNDRRVIYAMISNYQSRVEILQDVIKQIDTINNLNTNNSNDEIYI